MRSLLAMAALALGLAGCGPDLAGALRQLAPTPAEITASLCATAGALYAGYVEDRASGASTAVRVGADLGRSYLDARCAPAAVRKADAKSVRQLRRAERLLARARAGKAPDPADVAAAKADPAKGD